MCIRDSSRPGEKLYEEMFFGAEHAVPTEHPKVLRVAALSGGYSRDEANERLARNHGVVASFSRALTQGLSAQQSDDEFDAALDASVNSILVASRT